MLLFICHFARQIFIARSLSPTKLAALKHLKMLPLNLTTVLNCLLQLFYAKKKHTQRGLRIGGRQTAPSVFRALATSMHFQPPKALDEVANLPTFLHKAVLFCVLLIKH